MPSRIGRYVVRRRLGAGGFATVWLAYDEVLDSPVAVKVLADNWSGDHHVRDRFVGEGRYLRRVDSPYVVTVHDAGDLDDGRPYLVMTYADQGTLADRLELERLPAHAALQVVRQVGEGLGALHARGIVHRDVKPANVLFRSDADRLRAMVGDLGLGKALDASSRLTMVAGSPSFVAPEQAAGEAPDARADQFSLAVLTFLLLRGRQPWTHASLGAAVEPPAVPPVSGGDRAYPDEVDAVLRRALATDREQRWPDVASYVDALGRSLAPVLDDDEAERTQAWLPLDREPTHPGRRPDAAASSATRFDDADAAAPGSGATTATTTATVRRPPRRGLVALAGVVALAAGAAAGWWAERDLGSATTTVSDAAGTLSVDVPRDWAASTAQDGWIPPNAADGSDGSADTDYPALASGTGADWQADGQGVFVGLLPGKRIPAVLPQHPECDRVRPRVTTDSGGRTQVTVVSTSCPGGVVVERVRRATSGQLLWVQVRSRDQATANRVLDSVRTYGL